MAITPSETAACTISKRSADLPSGRHSSLLRRLLEGNGPRSNTMFWRHRTVFALDWFYCQICGTNTCPTKEKRMDKSNTPAAFGVSKPEQNAAECHYTASGLP